MVVSFIDGQAAFHKSLASLALTLVSRKTPFPYQCGLYDNGRKRTNRRYAYQLALVNHIGTIEYLSREQRIASCSMLSFGLH